jgi:phosphoadenosine phosphosulfate reductase
MPSKIDPMVYRLHACTPEYKQKHARLLCELRRQLDGTCYVSFSAGKDSAVCAHACNILRPGIPVLLVDPGCPTHWLENEREQWVAYAKEHAWNYHVFSWLKWRPDTSNISGATEYRAKVHASQFVDLEAWATEHGFKRRVMGLRGQESRVRRMSLATDHGASAKRLCPLNLWTTDDVWAYIITHGMPWLSIYDHLGPDARNGLIGLNGSQNGRLAFLKRHYPDTYRQARQLFNADDLR